MSRSLFQLALENTKPLAVVIQGNPKYLEDPKIAPLAKKFYEEIRHLLQARGYEVKFDRGEAYTTPDLQAAVWVAHSRGIDRLRFAPKSVKTIALKTMDHGKHYHSNDERGNDPDHYRLSLEDIAALKALSAA